MCQQTNLKLLELDEQATIEKYAQISVKLLDANKTEQQITNLELDLEKENKRDKHRIK